MDGRSQRLSGFSAREAADFPERSRSRSAIRKQTRPSPINKNPIVAHEIEAHSRNPPTRNTQPEMRMDRIQSQSRLKFVQYASDIFLKCRSTTLTPAESDNGAEWHPFCRLQQ